MIIYYCISLIILLIILMAGIVHPLCAFLARDTHIRFNGVLYKNLNEEKYKKILFSTFLNFIILILCLFTVYFKANTVSSLLILILGIVFLQQYILRPLK
ncbi:TPA: hypothetical protein ACOTG0_003171 [Clostridium perfringens]